MGDDSSLYDPSEPKVRDPRAIFSIEYVPQSPERQRSLGNRVGKRHFNTLSLTAKQVRSILKIEYYLGSRRRLNTPIFDLYNQNLQAQLESIWNKYQSAVAQDAREAIPHSTGLIRTFLAEFYANKWARAFNYLVADAKYQGSVTVLGNRRGMRYLNRNKECESERRKAHEWCKFGVLEKLGFSKEQLQQEADSFLS